MPEGSQPNVNGLKDNLSERYIGDLAFDPLAFRLADLNKTFDTSPEIAIMPQRFGSTPLTFVPPIYPSQS